MQYESSHLLPGAKMMLLDYCKERRYVTMLRLYGCMSGAVILLPLALLDLRHMLHPTLSTVDNPDIGLTLVLWLMLLVCGIVLFVRGYGKIFGRGSDYDCLKRDKYRLETMQLAEKQHDSGKHPYRIRDAAGNLYTCPVFLDYQQTNFGDELFCVILENGTRYAMAK